MSNDSFSHFANYFQVALVTNQDLLEQTYRIRYDVYCKEFHFEKEEDCPGGFEKDDYDQYSIHAMILHRTSGLHAGCVRLVIPPADDPSFQLPLEKYCGVTLTHETWHPARLPRNHITEVSRLAVHTSFRKRLGEGESQFGRLTEAEISVIERRTFPVLSLALFAASTALTVLMGRSEVFVMVDPRLARRLQSVGIPFVRIGDIMDYHGPRAAHYVNNQQVLDNMNQAIRSLYQPIYDQLKAEARQFGLHSVETAVD